MSELLSRIPVHVIMNPKRGSARRGGHGRQDGVAVETKGEVKGEESEG